MTPGPGGPHGRSVDPATIGSDPGLEARIRAEIERDGPIPFARFMAIVLYDPELGYYATSAARPTREGDFLTAPELHPVFGRMIGRLVADCWDRLGRPVPFVLREHGAGAGTLALDLLDGLEADGSTLAEGLRYEPVEVLPERLHALRERFAARGRTAHLALEPSGPMVGVVLANELLDALPVHRVERRGDALLERFVDATADGFAEIAGPPSTPALARRLADDGVALVEGQVAEICLALDDWVARVAADLRRGYVIVIDYGHEAAALYGPERREGTLRAYVGHRVHADPFRHLGRQDLTAHVDLSALRRAAGAAGLEELAATSQAELLVGLGIGDVLEAAGRATLDDLQPYLDLRAAVVRLLDPRAMGAFRVLAFGRAVPSDPPLEGFAFRLGSSPNG